jgi:hypothetical protein
VLYPTPAPAALPSPQPPGDLTIPKSSLTLLWVVLIGLATSVALLLVWAARS